MTARQFATRWLNGADRSLLTIRADEGCIRVPRACTCDEYPEQHWAMAHIEKDDPLPDLTIEWEPGDPGYSSPSSEKAR